MHFLWVIASRQYAARLLSNEKNWKPSNNFWKIRMERGKAIRWNFPRPKIRNDQLKNIFVSLLGTGEMNAIDPVEKKAWLRPSSGLLCSFLRATFSHSVLGMLSPEICMPGNLKIGHWEPVGLVARFWVGCEFYGFPSPPLAWEHQKTNSEEEKNWDFVQFQRGKMKLVYKLKLDCRSQQFNMKTNAGQKWCAVCLGIMSEKNTPCP